MSHNDRFAIKEPEFTRFLPLIKDIMGNHEFQISDYDKDGGTYWFSIDFFNGDPVNIDNIHLQFGNDPLILASYSMENIKLDIDLDNLDNLYIEIMLRIKKFSVIRESMFHEVYWNFVEDNFLNFSLQIESFDPLRLPKLAEVDEVMITIKEIILSYKTESKMT